MRREKLVEMSPSTSSSSSPTQAITQALASIPQGQTRSFGEVAAMAERPGSIRTVGRVVASCSLNSNLPWHRVVSSQGALAKSASKAACQLQRLRDEGARPTEEETNCEWAKRLGVSLIGCYSAKKGGKVFICSTDGRADNWEATLVEPLTNEDVAVMRGFRHLDASPFPAPPLPTCTFTNWEDFPMEKNNIELRVGNLDCDWIRECLQRSGYCHVKHLLSKREVAEIQAAVQHAVQGENNILQLLSCGGIDRVVDLSRFGGGNGKYYYLKDPLPGCVGTLQEVLYGKLRDEANSLRSGTSGRNLWNDLETLRPRKIRKGSCYSYPSSFEMFHGECRDAQQKRPSVIFLCYGKGGKNVAHRDLYGPVWHPLQAMVMLSQRGEDYQGGDFFLEEEASEAHSSPNTFNVPCDLGDLVIFCSNYRWDIKGDNLVKVGVRHGMHPVIEGQRYALGIVFHLAK